MEKVNEILLIEDSPGDEELTLRALQRHGIHNDVVVARDGQEALDYFAARGRFSGRNKMEMPELVLLDLKLPKVSGFEVLKAIRADKDTAAVPIVVLTTSDEDDDVVKSYQLGANSYVRKPVEFQAFSEAVKQLGIYWLLVNHRPSRN